MIETELILIGGRSGVGKATVAFAMHDLLSELEIRHALIEGDTLDLAWPPPWEHHLAERNLAGIWANYRALGYHRLIYTNTVSVLETAELVAANGGPVVVTPILLRCSDASAELRLSRREQGDSLRRHLERSIAAARRLEQDAPIEVHRIETDGRPPVEVAAEILRKAGWDSTSTVSLMSGA